MTESYKKRLTGRKPKLNPCTHCVMVRFDDEEYARFMERYRASGVYAKAVFCKSMALMLRLEKATKEITALAKDVISLAHTTRRINFTSDDYV